jgi:hypothetical protein
MIKVKAVGKCKLDVFRSMLFIEAVLFGNFPSPPGKGAEAGLT